MAHVRGQRAGGAVGRLSIHVLPWCLAGALGCGSANTPTTVARDGAPVADSIRRFCGDCHALPDPASFPREDWPREVRQGYVFYERSLRTDLPRPPEGDAVRFFQASAPQALVIDRAAERVETAPAIVFERLRLASGSERPAPAIAHLVWHPDERVLFTSDMRSGEVTRWTIAADGGDRHGEISGNVVARVAHACRLTPTSTGSDPQGWLLADLGSFHVVDHDRGRVLRIAAEGAVETLVTGLSRVVEARPWPPTGGMVVAEFGWRDTGALRLLPPEGGEGTVLDARHGSLGVRVIDLDSDGHDDIVCAFAQEHETVDVYWGREGGVPEHATIHRFPDPSWGSGGFDLADIDADGRIDILHVNGDMMDSGLAKPFHGVRWLRNTGDRRFECREIARIPAASQATAADLDCDGDLDIVVSALHPRAGAAPGGTFAALVWLEQVADGSFAPHTIALDTCDHAAFSLGDADGDGLTDIIAGVWRADDRAPAEAPVRVYLNRPPSAAVDHTR